MATSNSDADDSASRLWNSGTEITRAVSGTVLGGVLGGPVGAAIGAGAGSALGATLKEFAHRMLSRREAVRIGATFQYAAAAFRECVANGRLVRTDTFFSANQDERSAASEVIEGVLISAQRQHEERKIEYMGYLVANLAFEDQIDRRLANWVVKMAEALTWTQFVLLSIVGDDDRSVRMPDIEIGSRPKNWNAFGVHEQLVDLGYGRRGLIYGPSRKTERVGLSVPNMKLTEQKLGRGGVLLHGLMWLDRVPILDRTEVLNSLSEEATSKKPDVPR